MPIIAQGHVNLAAFLLEVQFNMAFCGFASSFACLRGFDAVINRIAQHVQQWCSQALQDVGVDLQVLTDG